jgi:hypothetical protein
MAPVGLVKPGGGRGQGSDASISYTPTVKLPESPRTIHAKVQLEPFISRLPPLGPAAQRGDQEVPSAGVIDRDLPDAICQAILTDFRVNLVFSSVRVHEEQPDLLIRGLIHQFAEHRSRPWYAKIPRLGDFLSQGDQVEGGAHLELLVSTPGGHRIGTYHGRSVFPDPNKTESDKEKRRRPRGEQLNRAFSESVRQIREQMLADQDLIGGQWRTRAEEDRERSR